MAKLTVTVAIFLLVCALAQARVPLDLKENDVTTEDLSTDVPESDPKITATWPTSILLPNQKLDADIETEAKPETSGSGKPESEANDFFPLTVINFHPINRHFRHHPSLTLRNRRPCHHHRLGKPLFRHREMTYGKDMLTSKTEVKEDKIPEIPARWLQFPDGDAQAHRLHIWRDDDVAMREEFRMPHDHHSGSFHRRHEAGAEEAMTERQHETGFLTKIRKFLNHF